MHGLTEASDYRMKPIDYRKATFAAIQGHLEGNRRNVYDALRTLGPQTTRALAQLAKMDLLTVRPRITELIDFVDMDDRDIGADRRNRIDLLT